MNINIDYGRKEEDVIAVPNAELTQDYIAYAVSTAHKEGLEGQQRRIWGRIQRKFDTAIITKAYDVELEQAELDFIRSSFKEAKFTPALAKYVVILEEALNK